MSRECYKELQFFLKAGVQIPVLFHLVLLLNMEECCPQNCLHYVIHLASLLLHFHVLFPPNSTILQMYLCKLNIVKLGDVRGCLPLQQSEGYNV